MLDMTISESQALLGFFSDVMIVMRQAPVQASSSGATSYGLPVRIPQSAAGSFLSYTFCHILELP